MPGIGLQRHRVARIVSQTLNANVDTIPASQADTALIKPKRSLLAPFNRAGAPSILDLGFDAQPGTAEAEAGGQDELLKQTSHDLVGFPGERIGHISYGFEGERWRIRNAVWVVAQSATGVVLLDQVYRAGYRLSFDPMINCSEYLESFVNIHDKAVCLDSRANTEQLVAMLSHNLGIAGAAVDGIFFDSSMSPPSALLAHRMAMAYALGASLQIAYELRESPTLPNKADRDSYWRQCSKDQSRMASAFAQTVINAMAVTNGSAMAAAIREFYDYGKLRERYDQEVINYYRGLPIGLLKDPKAMTGGFDVMGRALNLKLPGVVYATRHDPKLDLLDPENLGAGQEIIDAVAALQQARRNAGVKDRDSWQVHLSKV